MCVGGCCERAPAAKGCRSRANCPSLVSSCRLRFHHNEMFHYIAFIPLSLLRKGERRDGRRPDLDEAMPTLVWWCQPPANAGFAAMLVFLVNMKVTKELPMGQTTCAQRRGRGQHLQYSASLAV